MRIAVITRSHTVSIIHSPFRLSQFVPDPVEDQRLIEFTNSYWNTFRQYVREAARLGH